MRIKRTIQAIIFCIVFAVLFHYTYKVLSWKDTSGSYYSSMHSFYELEEDLVDVLFLGSSHCYCSVNNSLLWDEYGISSFSLSISGQDLASTYHCMVEGLKTQSPEVVMIEMYGAVFDGYAVEGNLYRNTIQYKFSENAYQAVDALVKDGQEGEYLLKWPIVHTRYAELEKGDFQKLPTYIGYQSGFHTQAQAQIVPYEGDPAETMGENREYWLGRIIDYAEEQGINICFFVAPYPAPDYEQMFYKRAEVVAAEHSMPFINMIDLHEELELDRMTDFTDWMHTNRYGADKVTRYLGEYLKSNYQLENHYGDDRYRLWDEDLEARQHEMINQQLRTTGDVKEYLKGIGELDGYTVVVAASGEYLWDGINLKPSLRNAGISDVFFESAGTWVFRNQEILYMSADAESFYHLDLQQDDLTISSSQGKKSIILARGNHCLVENGINIVVYDNVLGQLVDAVGFQAMNEYAVIR